ncbi:MAG: hypothetical protein ACP5OR_00330 [Candidatus Dormibacteria bacterium]
MIRAPHLALRRASAARRCSVLLGAALLTVCGGLLVFPATIVHAAHDKPSPLPQPSISQGTTPSPTVSVSPTSTPVTILLPSSSAYPTPTAPPSAPPITTTSSSGGFSPGIPVHLPPSFVAQPSYNLAAVPQSIVPGNGSTTWQGVFIVMIVILLGVGGTVLIIRSNIG